MNRKQQLVKFPLSASNQRKVRVYYKNHNQLNRNANEEQVFNSLGIHNRNQAYNVMAELYNNDIEAQNNAIDVEREITKQRQRIQPTEATFNIYELYKIPSYEPENVEQLQLTDDEVKNMSEKFALYSKKIIQKSIKKMNNVRVYAVVNFLCLNTQRIDETRFFTRNVNLGRIDINLYGDFKTYLIDGIKKKFEDMNGLDYIIVYGIDSIDINIIKYNPLQGASYTELPLNIKNSKSIINIKNKDQKCFLYSLIASRKNDLIHAERVSHYDKEEYDNPETVKFIYNDSDFPMAVSKIPLFEKKNNITIHVYTVDEKDEKIKISLYRSKNKTAEVVNLFYYNKHYSLIKSWSRFTGGDHDFVCPNCFWRYANHECFKNHIKNCENLNDNGSLVVMPKSKEITDSNTGLKYTVEPKTFYNNYKKQKKLPVVIYADFECNLEPFVYTCKDKLVKKKHDIQNKVGVLAKHSPNTYRIHIESDLDLGIPVDYEYSGNDVDLHFIDLLVNKLEKQIQAKLNACCEKHPKPVLNKQEEKEFQANDMCIFCSKQVKKSEKVRDHDHFTGKYEGVAHSKCNIKAHQMFKNKINIPVVFHNANYDIKCFISAFQKIVSKDCFVENIGGIACNMEIYKSININTFTIIDSYAHLTSSLDTLIKNLPDDKKTLLRTISKNEEEFNLIKKKGFYPYEMITNTEKLYLPIEDLKKEHFDNKLTLSKISDTDFLHVINVIKTFNIKNFKEYHDLYLKIDVFGLRDVFEYHRELSMMTYGLDPAHYIGLPQLTWDAGLKLTGIVLDDLKDIDMFMMFEKMKRGGVSVISHKYAKANNHYLPDYDDKKKSTYLIQLDCNNLYGKSMSEKLPVNQFEYVDFLTEEFIMSYDYETNSKGYVLEVDIDYPTELHETHNDYPLAPEHMVINKIKKLTPNLHDKKNYVVHIANLQYYLSMGMVLKQIHKVIEFNHSDWLAKYINHNSKLRQKATNDFEKDFYKLMNNAFYGKTMENVRNRNNVQFCLDKEKFVKHTSSPLFANQVNIIQENGLALVKTYKRTVELNKPIYIGATVLDLSKLLMYKFHYQTMKVRFPNSMMMKTDTDSLLYFVETDDLYQDFKEDPSIQKQIEFSNYPKNHLLYNCDRKKIPGLFQDECVGDEMNKLTGKYECNMKVISEYIGLRAKSYVNKLYDVENSGFYDKKKSKGVPNKHLQNRIHFNDYKDCVMDNKVIRLGANAEKPEHQEKIISFISHNLKTYSIEQSKIALSSNDDKRIPMPENRLMTYAHGHYKTL
jgi:hypothetical protein